MATKSKNYVIGAIAAIATALGGFAWYKASRGVEAAKNLGVSLDIKSIKNISVKWTSIPLMFKMDLGIEVSNQSEQSASINRIYGNAKIEGGKFADYSINQNVVLEPNSKTPLNLHIEADLITLLTIAKSALLPKIKEALDQPWKLPSLLASGNFQVGKKADITTTIVLVGGLEVDASFSSII